MPKIFWHLNTSFRLAPCRNLSVLSRFLSESASLALLSLRSVFQEYCSNRNSSTIILKDELLNYVLKLNNATDETRIGGYQTVRQILTESQMMEHRQVYHRHAYAFHCTAQQSITRISKEMILIYRPSSKDTRRARSAAVEACMWP